MQLQDITAGLPPTTFHYWSDPYARTHKANIQRAILEDKRDVYLTLDSTIFHPKSGGQPSDKGTVKAEDFQIQIKKSMLVGRNIVLWGRILEGTPSPAPVTEEIDWDWRYLLMRRHTAAHLFDHCLSSILGSEVETTDSWLGDPCYAGYKGQAVDNDKLIRAANLENDLITRGLTVRTETVSRANLTQLAARATNLWRVPVMDEYRIVTIEGCTPIPCGGTHVRNASEAKGIHFDRVEQLADSFRVYFHLA